MDSNNELFDKKMRSQFKRETSIIPEEINEEFENILKSESSKGRLTMGKLKRFGITAASLVCAATLVMQTAFAQDMVDKIIKSLSIDGLTVYENNTDEDMWARDMPEAVKGKVFDADGNVVEKINSENMHYLYNADGEHVWVDGDGILLTDEEMDEKLKKNAEENADDTLIIADLNELNKYISFEAKVPEYIPEGFEFINAECENYEKTGMEKSLWYSLNYENKKSGKTLAIMVKEKDDQGETSFNNIGEGKVNGNDAIIGDGEIAWSDNEFEYVVFMGECGREEGMKVAESIK